MASEEVQAVETRVSLARRLGTANPLPLFAGGLFIGAFLLFCIEPMFVKMLLPMLGGSPAVWNTAMVFFQAMLLCGYGYVHLTTRYLGVRWQAILHIALLGVSLLTLPVAVAAGWTPPVSETPVFWLIGLLTVSIGVPFFLLSATAPLLQSWFAETNHTEARDPYFLYGASNLGSLIALLCYPVVIEPQLALGDQSRLWTWGFTALCALIVLCALVVFSIPKQTSSVAVPRMPSAVRWADRIHWIALAFVPSSLMLGVTSYITTDLFSAPLLWVIPLALYLLTFVIAFARRPWIKTSWMIRVLPYSFILITITFGQPSGLWVILPLHLLAFFAAAMVCHGELARRRPAAGDLTRFYLCVSIGGVLGGLFNAILAPLIFNDVYEYPIALVLACLLVPATGQSGRWASFTRKDLIVPMGLLATSALLVLAVDNIDPIVGSLYVAVVGIAVFSLSRHPVRFALGMMALLVASAVIRSDGTTLEKKRSFFGVHKVISHLNGSMVALMHGTTIHGAEHTAPDRWRDITLYYGPMSPVGQVFAKIREHKVLRNVAITGLGAGSLACHRQPNESWTFFEIDPLVANFANDTRYFHYLSECAPDAKIVLGDARISLRQVPNRTIDVMVIDAFSSDAIPAHLLTREALALYITKLADGGVLMFHITNRHLALAPVLARLVGDAGLAAKHTMHKPLEAEVGWDNVSSEWVAIARSPEDLAFLGGTEWRSLAADSSAAVWTDDYTNLLGVLKIRK